jgi:hypothetical protein
MLEAVRACHCDDIIKYAMGDARNDVDVNLAALALLSGATIDWLVAPLNDDRNFMLRAVRVNPYALICASDRLLADEAFMAGIANVPNIHWPLGAPRLRGVDLRALFENNPIAALALRVERERHAQELQQAHAAPRRAEAAAMGEPARRRQRVA